MYMYTFCHSQDKHRSCTCHICSCMSCTYTVRVMYATVHHVHVMYAAVHHVHVHVVYTAVCHVHVCSYTMLGSFTANLSSSGLLSVSLLPSCTVRSSSSSCALLVAASMYDVIMTLLILWYSHRGSLC